MQRKYNMKVLRYILFLLIIGLYVSPFISTLEDTSSQIECESVILCDLLDDYAKRLQLQHDWTDALTSSQLNTCNQENRLRSRRHERSSTSWQPRTHTNQLHAILKRHEIGVAHNINQIVALSHILPLSLPTEQISFPFHGFW